MAVHARELHIGERVRPHRIRASVHSQTFKIKRRLVAVDFRVHAHCRRVTDPMVLRTKRAPDIGPVTAHLFVNLVVVRRVGKDGVVAVDAHHDIKTLLGKYAAGCVKRDLDIVDGQDIGGRPAVGLEGRLKSFLARFVANSPSFVSFWGGASSECSYLHGLRSFKG